MEAQLRFCCHGSTRGSPVAAHGRQRRLREKQYIWGVCPTLPAHPAGSPTVEGEAQSSLPSKAQPQGSAASPSQPPSSRRMYIQHSGHSSSQSARADPSRAFHKRMLAGADGSRGTKMEPPSGWRSPHQPHRGKTPHLAFLGFQSGDPKTWPVYSLGVLQITE